MTMATTANAPITITVQEAAKALSVSDDHVRGLISRRELGAVRLGKRIVIPYDALQTLLQRNRI